MSIDPGPIGPENDEGDIVTDGEHADIPEVDREMSPDSLKELADHESIKCFVDCIIGQAIAGRASHIHLDPGRKNMLVRYRVDGVLHDTMQPPKHIQESLIARIKIMSDMDTTETRIPQDGKIHVTHEGRDFDLHVSMVPCVYGEKTVIEILEKSAGIPDLGRLGLYPGIQDQFESLLQKRYGIILVTGPWGSGKSTTLYSALNRLNKGEVSIMTIEDRIDHMIEGIHQVQQNRKAGLTSGSALRAFLRQDPDIIMVGEISDHESLRIMVEAAIKGHLVLGTHCCNDPARALWSIMAHGIEPVLCASAFTGVLAQGLVRMICPRCKESYTPPREIITRVRLPAQADSDTVFHRGRGCEHCRMSGYRGRTGIFELLTISDPIRSLLLDRAPAAAIRDCAISEGMKTREEDGMRKVLEGITTIEECLRAATNEGW